MGPKVSRSSLNPVEMDRISADRSTAAAADEGSDRLANRLDALSSIAIRGWMDTVREQRERERDGAGLKRKNRMMTSRFTYRKTFL